MTNRTGSTRRPLPPAGRRGFTFIEILATLMLLAVVLPSVMAGVSISLAAADSAKRQAQASWLAHSKLTELLADEGAQRANLTGDFGADWPGFQWKAQLSDWDGSSLQQLDVTVSWEQRGEPRNVMLSSLLYTGSQQP